MLRLALRLMRTSVRRKAGADITTVSPLDVVPQAAIPAMFGHGEDDTFIGIAHSGELEWLGCCVCLHCMLVRAAGRCCSLALTPCLACLLARSCSQAL
jgi:hypothetical protein